MNVGPLSLSLPPANEGFGSGLTPNYYPHLSFSRGQVEGGNYKLGIPSREMSFERCWDLKPFLILALISTLSKFKFQPLGYLETGGGRDHLPPQLSCRKVGRVHGLWSFQSTRKRLERHSGLVLKTKSPFPPWKLNGRCPLLKSGRGGGGGGKRNVHGQGMGLERKEGGTRVTCRSNTVQK